MPYRRPDPRDQPVANALRAIGWHVRGLRTSNGLSQEMLENLTGVDQSIISRLENGIAPGMRLELLARLLVVLAPDGQSQ